MAVAVGFWFGTPGSGRKIDQEARERARVLAVEAHQRCLEGKQNRTALRKVILRGRAVGKPGTPGYDYYRTHPAEAKKARQQVDRALHDLPPISCVVKGVN